MKVNLLSLTPFKHQDSEKKDSQNVVSTNEVFVTS